MAKIKSLLDKQGYQWKYSTVGGVTRVNIEDGNDIAHLDELDKKLWTVLSCPVKGLEFDERTLKMLDTDGDGRIRVDEITAAAVWLRNVMTDMDLLFEGKDSISLDNVNANTDEGRKVVDSARLILHELGKDDEKSIGMADVDKYLSEYEDKVRAEQGDASAAQGGDKPYGDNSDDAEAAVNAIRRKIGDYFMRCRLAQFDEDATPALDVQVEKIAAIGGNDLTASMDEISAYPLARPGKEALLPLAKGINPAWQDAFDALKRLVLDVDFAGKESINEDEWKSVTAKIDAYTAWKAEGDKAQNEALAAKLDEHAAAIEPVEKLLRLSRDYVRLLHNYVVFSDFYSRTAGSEAIFQAGKLYIDQRCCELCVKVSDMGKATASAGLSGMYLIFCKCTSKGGGQTMDIVAALTDGDVDNLAEGKNAIFYDRNGQDWDATVTKIVDNPISVRQAFWSPYRKFGKWVTDKISKSAEEKEAKQFDEMTSKADAATEKVTAQQAGAEAQPAAAEKKVPFDIAKFAGIFAAIGLAIGAIGGALAALGAFVMVKWYNVIILVAAVVLLISGPSMLLAYLKLRKRNLGPVLNANGWAINSIVKVNIPFGRTLTGMAHYPKVVMKDPFKQKTPWWKKALWWLLVIVVVAFCVLLLTKSLPWQKDKAEPAADTTLVEAVADSPEAAAEATVDSAAIQQ